jgi:NAD(P)-dependent dehydrogenase (short-subunit alcohol dehydrogenase family)
MKLKGKKALITGGNSGIGLATARLFIAEGAQVAITGRDQKTLDAAVRELGPNARGYGVDVTVVEDRKQLFAAHDGAANRKLCDRAVSYVIEGRRRKIRRCHLISRLLGQIGDAKRDLDYENLNERPAQFLASRFLLPKPDCGAHAKHRYHPG